MHFLLIHIAKTAVFIICSSSLWHSVKYGYYCAFGLFACVHMWHFHHVNILNLEQFYPYFFNLHMFTSPGELILTRQWVLLSTTFDSKHSMSLIYLQKSQKWIYFKYFLQPFLLLAYAFARTNYPEILWITRIWIFEAQRALDTLNFHMIDGIPIRVMWSQRNQCIKKSNVGNIFIHNLPRDVDSKSFLDVCSIYGHVMSSKLVYKNSKQKGYGYV